MKVYPASITRRFWALVIDFFAWYILTIFMVLAIVAIGGSGMPMWLIWTISTPLVLCIMFYFPLMELLMRGRTPGKSATGIRVVSADGRAVSPLQSFQRYLMQIFDLGTLGVGGLVSVMVTEKRQRLGDILAGTVVVRDNAQLDIVEEYSAVQPSTQGEQTRRVLKKIKPGRSVNPNASPLAIAQLYRETECDIALLRTEKAHPAAIEYMERLLVSLRTAMFRRQIYTRKEAALYFLRSVPRAVYESRYYIFAALAIAVISVVIGIWQQVAYPGTFREMVGEFYYREAIGNMAIDNPMGMYSRDGEIVSFWEIFFNNFTVTIKCYAYGLIVLIGPLFDLLQNFTLVGTWLTFFAQNGYGTLGLISIHQHGVLELSSIIIAAGAAIQLGTGWLFPGKQTRLKAWARSARRSLLVMVSVLPMLLVAAFIESFITRHTEWPIGIRLAIIIVSLIFIIAYYVVLPIKAKRN